MIKLSVKTLDGAKHSLQVNEFDHLFSVISLLDIKVPKMTKPIFSMDGKKLEGFLSFKFQGVYDHATIMVMFKKVLVVPKRISYLDMMRKSVELDEFMYENSINEEEFRLADLSFLQIEASIDYARIIPEIKCCYKALKANKKTPRNQEPVILTNESTISDDPLPICWELPLKNRTNINPPNK